MGRPRDRVKGLDLNLQARPGWPGSPDAELRIFHSPVTEEMPSRNCSAVRRRGTGPPNAADAPSDGESWTDGIW